MTEETMTQFPQQTADENNGGVDDQHLGAAIEAVLFAAGYPVEYSKLCSVFKRDKRDMKRFIKSYAEKYNLRDSGIMMLVFENSVQLCTREEYKDYIREVLGIKLSGKLSASALEVLAIIAYNQPVTRAFIEQVRGVDCSYAITSLSDKGLIEAKGRLEVPGRPVLYGTTETFMRCFGITELSQLPEVEFRPSEEAVALMSAE